MKKAIIEFISIILFIALIFILFSLFYDTIKTICFFFVANFGVIGIFVLTAILDTIFVPLSPSIFVFAGTFGGADLWVVTLAGALGSCTAGVLGYFLGHKIGSRGIGKIFGKKNLNKGKKIFDKFGMIAIILGAATPIIPYSLMNWTAGIYKMRVSVFLPTIFVCRITKFFIVALLGTII